MSNRVDSPERKAALATSNDLYLIRATARKAHVGMRRLRWRVQGRICFTFQPYGTPYAEWGSLGRVYLKEDGTIEQAEYAGDTIFNVGHLTEDIGMVTTIGTAVAVRENRAVVMRVDILDTIALDLAAEPMLEEWVRDVDTGEMEIISTPTNLHIEQAEPAIHNESYEELVTLDVMSGVLLSWLWLVGGIASMLLTVAAGVYGAGLHQYGYWILALPLSGVAMWSLYRAIQLNDQCKEAGASNELVHSR